MIPYIKTAFTNPKEIYIGRNMKWRNFFSIAFLATILLTLISLIQYIPMLQSISDDFNEIKESIPAFELEDNHLTSSNKSYIYQTNSMMFYFDPDNRMDTDTINRNSSRIEAPVSTALLRDGLYMNFIGQEYFVSYSQIQNLTTSDLETLIASFGNISGTTIAFFIAIIFVMQFILFIYELIPITLIATMVSVFSRLRLNILQNYRIVLLAVIPPIILISLVHTLIIPIHFQTEVVLIMSLFTYYLSISELKKKLLEDNHK